MLVELSICFGYNDFNQIRGPGSGAAVREDSGGSVKEAYNVGERIFGRPGRKNGKK